MSFQHDMFFYSNCNNNYYYCNYNVQLQVMDGSSKRGSKCKGQSSMGQLRGLNQTKGCGGGKKEIGCDIFCDMETDNLVWNVRVTYS